MNIVMNKADVDVAVLLIFFNRPKQFSQVFEQVKMARPSKLFLYQDGARQGREDDAIGIAACRKIAEDIDWECEVHKLYQDKNFGCDPSEYLSQKWAFSQVDKCIVLEDDDVPSITFFRFCKELLDKYENDTRITMIAGLNHEEITPNITSDYFFTSNCSIWGWASWKRVIDCWDADYSFLDDVDNMNQLGNLIKYINIRKDLIPMFYAHKASGKEHYESIIIAHMLLNSGLSIVPTCNMINNVGDTADSTHFSASLERMPKGLRRIFTMQRYEIKFPLKHPRYVIENVEYKNKVYRIMAWNHPIIKVLRKIESLMLKLKYRDFQGIIKAIKRSCD